MYYSNLATFHVLETIATKNMEISVLRRLATPLRFKFTLGCFLANCSVEKLE